MSTNRSYSAIPRLREAPYPVHFVKRSREEWRSLLLKMASLAAFMAIAYFGVFAPAFASDSITPNVKLLLLLVELFPLVLALGGVVLFAATSRDASGFARSLCFTGALFAAALPCLVLAYYVFVMVTAFIESLYEGLALRLFG